MNTPPRPPNCGTSHCSCIECVMPGGPKLADGSAITGARILALAKQRARYYKHNDSFSFTGPALIDFGRALIKEIQG